MRAAIAGSASGPGRRGRKFPNAWRAPLPPVARPTESRPCRQSRYSTVRCRQSHGETRPDRPSDFDEWLPAVGARFEREHPLGCNCDCTVPENSSTSQARSAPRSGPWPAARTPDRARRRVARMKGRAPALLSPHRAECGAGMAHSGSRAAPRPSHLLPPPAPTPARTKYCIYIWPYSTVQFTAPFSLAHTPGAATGQRAGARRSHSPGAGGAAGQVVRRCGIHPAPPRHVGMGATACDAEALAAGR
jgi:hypothetical protein